MDKTSKKSDNKQEATASPSPSSQLESTIKGLLNLDLSNFDLANLNSTKVKEFLVSDPKRACKQTASFTFFLVWISNLAKSQKL